MTSSNVVTKLTNYLFIDRFTKKVNVLLNRYIFLTRSLLSLEIYIKGDYFKKSHQIYKV